MPFDLEAESIEIFREAVRRRRAAGAAVFGRQGLSRCCCTWRGRRSILRRRRFRCCTSTRPGNSRRCTRTAIALCATNPACSSSCIATRLRWRQASTPFTHGSSYYTDIMKTEALQAGPRRARIRRDLRRRPARRGSRRGPRSAFVRSGSPGHRWNPKSQRPELWSIYNMPLRPGETMRVFPLSNWTELDIWRYIEREQIPIVPLYFAADAAGRRARRHAADGRRRALAARARRTAASIASVRFRTLGCYPLTGAIESRATTSRRSSPNRRGARRPSGRDG